MWQAKTLKLFPAKNKFDSFNINYIKLLKCLNIVKQQGNY